MNKSEIKESIDKIETSIRDKKFLLALAEIEKLRGKIDVPVLFTPQQKAKSNIALLRIETGV